MDIILPRKKRIINVKDSYGTGVEFGDQTKNHSNFIIIIVCFLQQKLKPHCRKSGVSCRPKKHEGHSHSANTINIHGNEMNRCEILSRSKWQAEDFACGSLSSKLPFLRRNNQVHRSSTAAPDSRRANRKRDNALKGNVYVHFLHPQFGFPDVYTYHRKVDEGLPCPFCGRNTVGTRLHCRRVLPASATRQLHRCLTSRSAHAQISEEGLWVHLMTSKGDHLALVPNYADNGTVSIIAPSSSSTVPHFAAIVAMYDKDSSTPIVSSDSSTLR